MVEENLNGQDARVEHDHSCGTRWDALPRRRCFFSRVDKETVNSVHDLLRNVQHHDSMQDDYRCSGRNVEYGVPTTEDHGYLEADFVQTNDEYMYTEADEMQAAYEYTTACGVSMTDNYTTETVEGTAVVEYAHLTDEFMSTPRPPEVSTSRENARVDDTGLPEAATISLGPSKALRSGPTPIRLQALYERVAARQRTATLAAIVNEWSCLARKLGETRRGIDVRFEKRQKVRNLVVLRKVLVALKRNISDQQKSRRDEEAAEKDRRIESVKRVLDGLQMNLQRGQAIERASETLRQRIHTASARRAKLKALRALRQAWRCAEESRRCADDLHAEARTRFCAQVFGAWAWAAGLAERLRKRLGRADKALLANVVSAWALFSKHCADRRRAKWERTEARRNSRQKRVWDTEIMDVAFVDWANATAAGKFRRLRLSARVLRAWRAVTLFQRTCAHSSSGRGGGDVRTGDGTTEGGIVGGVVRLSRAKREKRLQVARTEADTRFSKATQGKLAERFESWARGAGLENRLQRRLTKAENELVRNMFCAWVTFERHCARQRESRVTARAAARRDGEVLRAALWAWASATAAEKFFRLRCRRKVFVAWRDSMAVRVSCRLHC